MTTSPPPVSLSSTEAAARLAAEGPNELPSDQERGWLRLIRDVVTEPMILLLLGAGGVYLALGDRGEAAVLLAFVVVVAGITVGSERRTERAVAALRDLTSPRARVVRDGEVRRIAGREVVRGDLLLVDEGDRIAADAVLLDGELVEADESLLTGESVPVRKRPGDEAAPLPPPGGDDLPALFAGTVVVRGRGRARVVATGPRTAIGAIGRHLATTEPERGLFHAEVDRLVKVVAIGAVALCAALVVVRGAQGQGWLQGLLEGLTLAMAILPEEFPVVLTVFLGLGAWRLSRRGALTRRTGALGSLASLTVLCTDKTGTLTTNQMAVRRLVAWDSGAVVDGVDGLSALPEAVHALVEHAVLASQADPFDPMERALHTLAQRTLVGTEHLHDAFVLDRTYGLEPTLLALSHAWRAPDGSLVVAAKGAPEAVVDLCHLPADAAAAVLAAAAAMAADGLRVLGVARAVVEGDTPLAGQHDYTFAFVGLVGLVDPLRPAVPSAVAAARRGGIRVVLVTGDHAVTARTIADAAGIEAGRLLTGPEVEAMSDEALRAGLVGVTVVARAVPEHKLRLVRALQATGEVVGMTGDGVNDAPALRAADVGVAMGGRGTDVAREAAAIVLTDDDFATIIEAVRLARGLRGRLQRAMGFIVAVHVPMAGLAMVPALLGWPALLGPVHVALLELLIDPACTLVFDAEPDEDGDVMDAPPPRGALLSGKVLWRALAQGAAVLAALVAALWAWRGLEEGAWRAVGFGGFLVGNVALIHLGRSWSRPLWAVLRTRNRPALALTAAVVVLLGALWVPMVAGLLRVDAPPGWALASAALAAVGAAAVADRLVGGRRGSPRHARTNAAG
jgi:Ca2+-transporting ATPase